VRLKEAGLRCGMDISDEKIGAKIARAHGEKVAYMVIVGPKEAESETVSVRARNSKDTKRFEIDELVCNAKAKIDDKSLDLAF